MHSTIYQIRTSKIDKEDYIVADYQAIDSFFDNKSLQEINADHIDDSLDRDEDIKWLQLSLAQKGIEVVLDQDAPYLIIISKDEYLKDSDHFPFYVSDSYYDFRSFENFVKNADENIKYYIGGVLDFHYTICYKEEK